MLIASPPQSNSLPPSLLSISKKAANGPPLHSTPLHLAPSINIRLNHNPPPLPNILSELPNFDLNHLLRHLHIHIPFPFLCPFHLNPNTPKVLLKIRSHVKIQRNGLFSPIPADTEQVDSRVKAIGARLGHEVGDLFALEGTLGEHVVDGDCGVEFEEVGEEDAAVGC